MIRKYICNSQLTGVHLATNFRDNLDWLAKATNWAKFTATASIGVIHHGHETNALKLMYSYLPKVFAL